ncbi:MAG: AgmX/PglI C-terminal domain-containing protein [Deltaproteobacteria bacterium]|nr:AgmX/PglI C-terminal domain-containing protein [Deltaproteobacteria bacterium]
MVNVRVLAMTAVVVVSGLSCRKSEQPAASRPDAAVAQSAGAGGDAVESGPATTVSARPAEPLGDAEAERLLGAPYEDHTNRLPAAEAAVERDIATLGYGSGEAEGGLGIFGLGLGDVGAMGHGYGTGDGVGFGRGGGAMGRRGRDAGDTGPDLSGRVGRSPDLRLGEVTTFGGLSKEVIRRIVQQHRGRVRHCYEAALRTAPALAGRVTVKFVVGPQGSVSSAEAVGNTSSDTAFAECVVAVVKRMSFPQADGVTACTFPFLFQMTGEDEIEVVVVAQTEQPPAPPPPDPTQGALRAKNSEGELVGEFPLRHTEVTAEITGYVARTVVEQTYENDFREVIEAVYQFPLPSLGAVNDFVMEIGTRKIVGIVRPREEAERIYAEARAAGYTASLLTQERPNLFTQNVANIEPGGTVKIRITYFERLVYEHGIYQWVFPMVVGPRYIPGGPPTEAGGESGAPLAGTAVGTASGTPAVDTAGIPPATDPSVPGPSAVAAPSGGGGTSPPTGRVPDADRITPPVLLPGTRSGHDIGLTVTLEAGVPLRGLRVVTHEADVEETSPTRRVIKLLAGDSIPNRDFVLRWIPGGVETQVGVLAHRGAGGGFLTLMMQPPLAPSDEQVTPRELTFLLDVSGSMQGQPLDISKALVQKTLDSLRPEDAFNVVTFASGNAQLFDGPMPGTEENIAAARRFLETLGGGGGTEMLAGMRRALGATHEPKFLQMYMFLTDGYVGDEEEILRVIREERGGARFFAFGIGSGVNRFLIDGIGEHGGGASQVILPRESEDAVPRAVEQLFTMIDSPVLVDVEVDWNGLPVADVFPAKLPDLFAGQTVNLVGRYSAAAEGTAYVRGRVGARRVEFPVVVVLPESEEANAALGPIWARWRIEELTKARLTAEEAEQAELKQQITDLAVEFRLVSEYTAFVAVDESRVVGNGQPLRVIQPVELPEGVSYEGVFGEPAIGEPLEIAGWGLIVQMSESGKIRIGTVREQGAARAAGIEAGAQIRSVNGTVVNDVRHLEGLILQSGPRVRLGLEPGGEVELPAP